MPTITCTACGSRLKAPDAMIGRTGRCPKCGMLIKLTADPVPLPPNETLPTAPPSASTATQTAPATPPPPTRDQLFTTHLTILYQSLGIRDPLDYLAPLAAAFTQSRQATADRKASFHSALAEIYVSIAPPNLEKHLPALAEKLTAWRTRSKSRMAGYFAKLPADDPLRCPISLFGVMERGRLETAHTAVLAWLLDPRREHGFGPALLAELLTRLAGPTDPSSIIVEKCEPEFAIADGRLDVLLQGTARRIDDESSWSWLLMIEAKIDANEGVQQLKRYDKWAQKYSHGRDILRLFLTPDGRPAETADDDWTPISFLDLACLFRKHCPDLGHKPGYHFLRYYIAGVLKDIYHWNLPIGDPEFLDDPYNFLEYLEAVFGDKEMHP